MRVLKTVGILVLSGVSALACERADVRADMPPGGSAASPGVAGAVPANNGSGGDFDAPAARQILTLINTARLQAGQSPLVLDEALTHAAQTHVLEMLRHGALSHQVDGESSLSERLTRNGVHFSRAAENIVLDFSPEHAEQSLMASDDHRRNLLDSSFNTVGIAAVWERCQLYVVQDFARQVPKYEAGQAEDLIAQKVALLRTQTRLPQLKLVKDPDASRACAGANRHFSYLSNARYVLSYSNTEPGAIPPSAASLIANRQMKDVSIGACYARTEKNPSGAYFVTMMFY